MDREIKTIKTPIDGHEVAIKTYLTGREKRALTSVFLKGGLSFDISGEIKGLQGSIYEEAENLLFQTIVVSIDGKAEDIVNTILNMRAEDYQFIVNEVNKVSKDATFEEKKTR